MSLPNVLMIVTDQQRRDSVGAYGAPTCRTPHMDALAADGMRFDNAFTPTGLCSPVRCSFFSGLYAHGHGVLTNVGLHPVRAQLEPTADHLTPALAAAGYSLGYVGKWHVSARDPSAFGFQNYVSLGDFEAWRRSLGEPIPDAMFEYTRQVAARDPAPAQHSRPAFLCDNAVRLIDEYRTREAPFFIRLDFHGPHFPNVVPEPWFSLYDPRDIEPWPNHDDSLIDKPAVQRTKRRHWGTDVFTWADWQPLIAAYYGEIGLIDDQVGRVLEHLAATGLADDTLVIWTTDHGDTIGAHGICNKDYTMYEEIYRVPLIIRWPGVTAPGSTCGAFVHHFLDLFATLRDVIGADPADGSHGRSLAPLLRGEPTPDDWPRDAYCQFHGSHMGLYSMRLLTNERYAYVYHTNDIDELYDRRDDPWQLHNLAASPGKHAAALDGLRRRLVEWMANTGDHLYNEWTVDWLTHDETLARAAPGRRRTRW